MKIKYPPKPWTDGQKAELQPGLRFVYSGSLRKWVPITPDTFKEEEISKAFGVTTVAEVEDIFKDVTTLKEEMLEFGRIWTTDVRPNLSEVHDNDIWIDPIYSRMFWWDGTNGTWIQITQSLAI